MGDRHRGTGDEQAERREQRPDVGLPAEAQRVLGLGRAPDRLFAIIRKISLPVSAQECAASATIDAEPVSIAATDLADRDQEIRAERDEHGQRALGLGRRAERHDRVRRPAGAGADAAGTRDPPDAAQPAWGMVASDGDQQRRRREEERGHGALPRPRRGPAGAAGAHGWAVLGPQGRACLVYSQRRARRCRGSACGRRTRVRGGARFTAARTARRVIWARPGRAASRWWRTPGTPTSMPRTAISNTFEMEWPPRSGRMQIFPEVDRAEWFDLATARVKLVKGQVVFLDRLGGPARQGRSRRDHRLNRLLLSCGHPPATSLPGAGSARHRWWSAAPPRPRSRSASAADR